MQKYIVIVVIVLIIILGITLIFKSSTKQTAVPNSSSLPVDEGKISVISSFPSNNAQDIGVFGDISIKFSKPISPQEQRGINLASSPIINGVVKWSSDRTVLTITPNQPLTAGQKYSINLTYSDGSYSFSFTTTQKAITSTKDQIQAQAEADKNYADWQKNTDQTYPWLARLPLQTADYFAYFDINDKKFYADIHNANKSEELKQEIVQQLKQITGSDFDKFPIEYTIK